MKLGPDGRTLILGNNNYYNEETQKYHSIIKIYRLNMDSTDFNTAEWLQIGQDFIDINSTCDDIAINHDGSMIAIAKNYYPSSPNDYHVIIYYFDQNTWIQAGNGIQIEANSQNQRSLSIDFDGEGKTLAVNNYYTKPSIWSYSR